jgi:hypothetical protein
MGIAAGRYLLEKGLAAGPSPAAFAGEEAQRRPLLPEKKLSAGCSL